MSTYAFEVLSPDQARAFTSADSLLIADPAATPGRVSVALRDDGVTFAFGDRSLTFGEAFTDQVRALHPEGLPTVITGTPAGDVIVGRTIPGLHVNGSGDAIYGGGGDDTIDGAGGADTLSGGAGADLIVFARHQASGDVITDFGPGDRLAFHSPPPAASRYLETTASSEAAANSFSYAEIAAGRADLVATQVGSDVYVYVDSQDMNTVGSRVILRGVALDDIELTSFAVSPAITVPTPPAPPPVNAPPPLSPRAEDEPPPRAPAAPAIIDAVRLIGVVAGDMDAISFSALSDAEVQEQTSLRYALETSQTHFLLAGGEFAYDSHGVLIDGRVGHMTFQAPAGTLTADIFINGFRATAFSHWVSDDATAEAFAFIFGQNDQIAGSAGSDRIRAFAGQDEIAGAGGADTIFGGLGDDVIYAGARPGELAAVAIDGSYLRGEEGDDWIQGAASFDDINGNQGNDTASGGEGDDWVVGGKDNDLLFGDSGRDLVYGNIGDDTCDGGVGDDVVRGGQGDDILFGYSGADFLSGDRGSDTITGGSGVDTFHLFAEAGFNLVTDFDFAEGDRVMLAPGSRYTVAQVGADTEITVEGGARMILTNVALLSLSPGWIFGS